jgi:hypothetical protein
MPTYTRRLPPTYGPEAESLAVAWDIAQAKLGLSARIHAALTGGKPPRRSWKSQIARESLPTS